MKTASQKPMSDTLTQIDPAIDRQKRLLSIMLAISSFVIYNGRVLDLDKNLADLAIPE